MMDDDYSEVNLTPSIKSPGVKFNTALGSPTDNDSYGEESFETDGAGSPPTKSPKKSPSKSPKKSVKMVSPRMSLVEKLAKEEAERGDRDDDFSFSGDELDGGVAPDGEQEGEQQEENYGDMNLDDFLQRFGSDGDGDNTEPKKEDPSLRPLEGFSPPANAAKRDLINSQKLNSPPAGDTKSGISTSPVSIESQTERLKAAISAEEANAAKVDALLRKLNVKQVAADVDEVEPRVPYPVMQDSTSHLANNYKHPKKEVKFEKTGKLPLFDKYNAGVKRDPEAPTAPIEHTRDSNMLAAQVATLKADLKRRDDRLGRIVEHDALVTSKCESLTREVAFLKQSLHESQLECMVRTAGSAPSMPCPLGIDDLSSKLFLFSLYIGPDKAR